MARQGTHEQELAIMDLNPGDVFTFKDRGMVREAIFVKNKQVNILGIIDGAHYNIAKCNFIEISKKADKKEAHKMDMKPGELFYVKKGSEALLFEFVEMQGYVIIGKNVITGGTTNMHQSMFAGTVKQYQKEQKQLLKAE